MGADPDRLIALLEGMVSQQSAKVKALARRLAPQATDEDLLNPHDIPLLANDMHFNYEDGHLNGLQSAVMALRAERYGATEI
ncbi:MAG: hypothetical protein AB7F75_12770 [Planctomycetota bacterium]